MRDEMLQVAQCLMSLALLSLACASPRLAQSDAAGCDGVAVDHDDDVVAAALIHVFKLGESIEEPRVYFVGVVSGENPLGSLYGLDPSAALLSRLAPHASTVRPVSVVSPDKTFRDPTTGERGLLFVASNICRHRADEVQIDVTKHFGPNSRMTFTLRLSNRQGDWQVKSCVVTDDRCERTA